jgi:hypothetical protein
MIRNAWPQSGWGKLVLIILIAFPVVWLLDLWSLVSEWLAVLSGFLAASTLVPNWLLALLAICAIIVAGLFGALLRPRRETTDPEKEDPP